MQRPGLALCVLLGLVPSGLSIMCYECNSATNSYCAEAMLPASLARNCSAQERAPAHTLCRKIVQHVDYEVNGHAPASRIIRTCGWDDSKYKGVCYHRAGYGGRQEVCSCSSDFCNGSSGLLTPHCLIITSLTMIIGCYLSKKHSYTYKI